MPTHRGGRQGDPILWRARLSEAEAPVRLLGLSAAETADLLRPARRLVEDVTFWRTQLDGLACFLAPDLLRHFRLPIPLKNRIVVGSRFHITPLLPLLHDDGRFFVLALSRNSVRLLHGTRDWVREIDVANLPSNLEEALPTHDTDEPLNLHTVPSGVVGSRGAIFHGHGVGIDDAKDDLLLYFRRIDKAIHPMLRGDHVPLIVAAVDYLLPIYRKANTYPHLWEEGLPGNPDRLSNRQLHDRGWSLIRPQFEATRNKALNQYRQFAGTGHTTADLDEIVRAANHGEVETLFLAPDRPRWGRFDPSTEQIEEHERQGAGDEDLVNLAAVHALAHHATVYALSPEEVPNQSAVAAVLRRSAAGKN
jgi:hypothetical protein